MINLAVLALFAFQAAAATAPAATPAPATAVQPAAATVPAASNLLQVKRIFVDTFGDDEISKQIQAMVITGLVDSKEFIVTENKAKADAILRGSGLEKTSQEVHAYGESTAAGAAGGGHSGSVSGSWSGGTGSISGSSSGGFASRAAAISDSSLNTETINDARAAVRLVNQDGDVLWATTQESKGAKYKGASADVADEIVKQLLRDLRKARSAAAPAENK